MTTISASPIDTRLLERSDSVLWTLAGDGIVLHNFVSKSFLQLDAVGYRVWAFLDGARTVNQVVTRVGADDVRVRDIVETLIQHGFVEEIASGG